MVTNNAGKTSAKNMARPRRGPSSISSSSGNGFRLSDGGGGGGGGSGSGGGIEGCDTVSSISRNSIYKLKIDAMFDDSRSIISSHHQNRHVLDVLSSSVAKLAHGSGGGGGGGSVRSSTRTPHRSSSVRSGSLRTTSTSAAAMRYLLQQQQQHSQHKRSQHSNQQQPQQQQAPFVVEDDVQRVSNKVQDQIERMFTDVIKDVTSCSFAVKCLGSLPLAEKVTSLLGLQEPLRQLYLSGAGHGDHTSGNLDICASGLRVRLANGQYAQMTPFHNIAVWSAVKFIVSPAEGGAAFLPLITDPENIDKSSLFKPLSAADKRRLSSGLHSPIFAVVMRSTQVPRQLECHAFVCTSPEDAIVIAATLYQSLMTHMNSSQTRKARKPRNQNGVSCISIASSSATANLQQGIAAVSAGVAAAAASVAAASVTDGAAGGGSSGSVNSRQMSSRELNAMLRHRQPSSASSFRNVSRPSARRRARGSNGGGGSAASAGSGGSMSGHSSDFASEAFNMPAVSTEERKKKSHKTRRAPPIPVGGGSGGVGALVSVISVASGSDDAGSPHRSGKSRNVAAVAAALQGLETGYTGNDPNGGDIFTRVAIPRSGSFLNTSGLTRYKSRATRRAAGKNGVGGGGGSPLGFSELFNEFRLQENLHSLDDILNAIINFDGMSFNDLKPIYKEFLLKLAVTLTKDELYQRSKSIMRRQKKKKLRRKPSSANASPHAPNKSRKTYILGSKSLSKVFRFGKQHFTRFHKGKLSKKALAGNGTAAVASNGNNGSKGDAQTRIGGTSGSDVSVMRNELTLSGQNRNSSSGYVSCSECSYDSEACTCASADRCYCSLVIDHDRVHAKLQRPNNAAETTLDTRCHRRRHGTNHHHRSDAGGRTGTLCDLERSDDCATDTDKCYCSLGDVGVQSASSGSATETQWCDSDSCTSNTKCYCQAATEHQQRSSRQRRRSESGGERSHANRRSSTALPQPSHADSNNGGRRSASSRRRQERRRHEATLRMMDGAGGVGNADGIVGDIDDGEFTPDNLALDYELFTVTDNANGSKGGTTALAHSHGGGTQHVRVTDALSAKKSVEVAAIFGDYKLTQSTDIHNLVKVSSSSLSGSASGSARSTRKSTVAADPMGGQSQSGRKKSTATTMSIGSGGAASMHGTGRRSAQVAPDSLNTSRSVSLRKGGVGGSSHYARKEDDYQAMQPQSRPVSATLEDSLGYLP